MYVPAAKLIPNCKSVDRNPLRSSWTGRVHAVAVLGMNHKKS